MTKVIVLSTVLGLSALGMACGEAPANNTANKPAANTTPASTPAPVMTVAPAMTPAANANSANAMGAKPATNAAANTMKPAANTMKPAANATPKK
ncbi:hypothetical protein BH10ACI3_BH10ACI3_25970 [soil metagenome]